MANRSDPYINSISGSDPQNCLEYITRQRIYDCRYWKEVCFGLTVMDVLEKSVEQMKCLGTIPYTTFVSLLLKLLQLNADYETINVAFIEQDEFKYTRALGMMYIRLTCRPADIYKSLEPYYSDYRRLRIYQEIDSKPAFDIITIDQYIHQLLTSTTIFGIALPRLPNRNSLQIAGYLPNGIRPTALKDVLLQYENEHENKKTNDSDDAKLYYKLALKCLKEKAVVDKNPSAIIAWEKRSSRHYDDENINAILHEKDTIKTARGGKDKMNDHDQDVYDQESDNQNRNFVSVNEKAIRHDEERPKKKKKRKLERNFDNLFKKSKTINDNETKSIIDEKINTSSENGIVEGSEEYWNEQRKKLGLKPLKS